jgi:ribosome-binding protein aMBF1 (putative translation factor)
MDCKICGKKFTCGCQKVKLSNGTTVCKGCSKKDMNKDAFNAYKNRKAKTVRKNEYRRSVHNKKD